MESKFWCILGMADCEPYSMDDALGGMILMYFIILIAAFIDSVVYALPW